MDTMIRELITADHDARKEVEQVMLERSQIRALVEAQKADVFKRHTEDANMRLQDHIKHLKQEIEDTKRNKDEEYERMLLQLKENFEKNKDGWVQDIVERCLKG